MHPQSENTFRSAHTFVLPLALQMRRIDICKFIGRELSALIFLFVDEREQQTGGLATCRLNFIQKGPAPAVCVWVGGWEISGGCLWIL